MEPVIVALALVAVWAYLKRGGMNAPVLATQQITSSSNNMSPVIAGEVLKPPVTPKPPIVSDVSNAAGGGDVMTVAPVSVPNISLPVSVSVLPAPALSTASITSSTNNVSSPAPIAGESIGMSNARQASLAY